MLCIAANLSRRSILTTAAAAAGHGTHALPLFAARAFSLEETAGVIKGTVKWFDAKKGFGFLCPDDGSPDVFVHHSVIHANGFRSLGDGEAVEFEIMEEPNGKLRAMNVTGPGGAYVQGAPRRMQNDGPYYSDERY